MAEWMLETLLFRISAALKTMSREAIILGDPAAQVVLLLLEYTIAEWGARVLGWLRGYSL